MVDPKIFKIRIRKLISQKYKIEFLGDNLDKIINKISDIKAEKVYDWIKRVTNKNIQPITVGSKKKYKEWEVYNLLFFRKEMKIDHTEYRIFFMKVKNLFYIEFHLGKHSYYDKLRKKLDLTKKNY